MSTDKRYRFEGLWSDGNWTIPAFVDLDSDGKIIGIVDSVSEESKYETINGYVLPGMQNAHSHAFQYAMVGLTEIHDISGARDDFWGWRNAMYQLALSIDPEQMEAIASALYKEMLRHGYTHVAEFHYVHHDKNGQPYNNVSELGERLVVAAKNVGIRITLIPVFYQKGGFGKEAGMDQKRFLSNGIDSYEALLNSSKKSVKYYNKASLGCGIHSLRAVDPKIVKEYCADYLKEMPFHIHVSEQLKELEQSLAYLGQRPVEWMLNNLNLNQQFNLVHATHMNEQEIIGLAQSNARVVLCPSTEGNLGDGIFRLKKYQSHNGRWSIGTDSHIGLNPFEELRILDYGQRLTTHQRNSFTDENEGNSGNYAIDHLVSNGRSAMGRTANSKLGAGNDLDAIIFNADVPVLSACSRDNLLNTIVYASDVSMHLGTMVSGQWVIERGKHSSESKINSDFKKALIELSNR